MRSSLLAVLATIAAVLIGATASYANAYPEEVIEKKSAEITSYVCMNGGKEPRSRIWYETHSAIQRMAPYDWVWDVKSGSLNPNYNPMEDTLKQLYGDRKFNPRTRVKLCADLQNYAKKLTENIIAHKGKNKICCIVAEDTEKFFEKKIDAQIDNNNKQKAAIDSPGYYESVHEGNDLKYLDMWACDPDEPHCD
ncbi:hypothetical protein OG203_37030 [Nocardia sp. NBC_01499]|uniref:hypothetical protein n=1 Tax=Nocardia sp. NBC_01499 TaxID=2903597 RepID=UPI00386D9725